MNWKLLAARAALVAAAILLGASLGFSVAYLIEELPDHHPHAMTGLFAILVGIPSGALVGLVGGTLFARALSEPRRILAAAAAAFCAAVLMTIAIVLFIQLVVGHW